MKITYINTLFKIEVLENIKLPTFKGSTFRGVFGNTFKKIVCILKNINCDNCLLQQSCIYAYIFETPPPKDKDMFNMGKYKNIPHPFIIEPPLESKKTFNAGEELTFSVILIGKAKEYLPYFIYTFSECGKKGIGKERGQFVLKEVSTFNEEKIYDNKDKKIYYPKFQCLNIDENLEKYFKEEQEEVVTLRLITPLRLKYNNDLVTKLDFYIFIKALMLRINLLAFFHCEGEDLKWDYKKLLELAKKVKIIEDKTDWWDWERYSTRQKSKMKFGGLIGSITYKGYISPFKQILLAGETLHVGKNTSFGLGKYEILK